MATEPMRLELFQALEQALGPGPAGTLMTLLPRGDVALRSDVAEQGAALRGDLAELRSDLTEQGAALRGEIAAQGVALRGEIAAQGAQLRAEIAEVRDEVAALRNDLTKLEAKVDAQVPRFLVASMPMMFGTAGLVMAAGRLL